MTIELKWIIWAVCYIIIGAGGLALLNTVLAGISSTSSNPSVMTYVKAGLFWPIYIALYCMHMIFG